MTEAEQQAVRALQEALDRRDNGGEIPAEVFTETRGAEASAEQRTSARVGAHAGARS